MLDDARDRHEGREDRGDRLKNSTAPLRTCASRSVSEPSWLAGKSLMSSRPAGRLADAVDRFLRADVDRMARVLAGRELVA